MLHARLQFLQILQTETGLLEALLHELAHLRAGRVTMAALFQNIADVSQTESQQTRLADKQQACKITAAVTVIAIAFIAYRGKQATACVVTHGVRSYPGKSGEF